MTRIIILALGLALFAAPAWADSQMRQSPLMMRRAGPSCQPGHLGAQAGAGYYYRLGPCAGADAEDSEAAPDPRAPRLRRYGY